ncbi:MAG: hypothetical protein AVDCRST_MAG26-258 [uncultured Chloroflexia bacterium]|uniref:Uncharacterized protein n=1 Tax=uncultured Chloroflexia bacterium TaxID=1672391 RepID=A0A6J4H7C0_9CHLR|nr:MAG: hypothetical protein AVDCRST_MAG26-258 [uncultured Chloroflexia bacterium]
MNRIVAAIWSSMLVATVVGVVPVVVNLLRRGLAAARNIERYTGEILTAGVGIANNTAHAAALKDTLAAAPLLLEGAASIERHASTVVTALGSTGDGTEASS